VFFYIQEPWQRTCLRFCLTRALGPQRLSRIYADSSYCFPPGSYFRSTTCSRDRATDNTSKGTSHSPCVIRPSASTYDCGSSPAIRLRRHTWHSGPVLARACLLLTSYQSHCFKTTAWMKTKARFFMDVFWPCAHIALLASLARSGWRGIQKLVLVGSAPHTGGVLVDRMRLLGSQSSA